MAICKCHGVLAQLQVDYSLTADTFIEMLDNISGAVKGTDPIYLFLDGASIHRNPEVKKRMKDLNIQPVENVGYRYEYNPCERLWS